MPTFDQFDAGILSERQKARLSKRKIQQGDFIRHHDGRLARVTHVWEDGAQTTRFSETGEGGSFYLGEGGGMSYSGSLEPSLPLTHLRESSDVRKGRAWIFHHNRAEAHNGVDCELYVRVWDYLTDAQAVDASKGNRWIIQEPFKGHSQSFTVTTFDGVERVAYTGLTLAEYMAENPTYKIISEDELHGLMTAHEESLKTKPEEITEEQYWDWLECLPPCRYDGNRFHISERLTGNLVQWCFRKDGKFYGFTDDAGISDERLGEIIRATGV